MVVFIGIFLAAFVSMPLPARTAAIAASSTVFVWFKIHGMLPLSLLAWDTIVVFGLAVALPVALSLWVLFSGVPARRFLSSLCLAFGAWLSFYALVPLHDGRSVISPFALPWWQHGRELSLFLAVGLAYGASRATRLTFARLHSSRIAKTNR
jgi:hypothetical protein